MCFSLEIKKIRDVQDNFMGEVIRDCNLYEAFDDTGFSLGEYETVELAVEGIDHWHEFGEFHPSAI